MSALRPPAISVIIATEGRASKLTRTLEGLGDSQGVEGGFEVVVALDGEHPRSRTVGEQDWPFPVKLASQRRSGTGATRNFGVSLARAPLVLFLNDDTRPAPDCLAIHLEAQARRGPAILMGHVDWDPERPISPYMRWLAPGGHQFHFNTLDAEAPVPWHACWSAQLSLPRSWAEDQPFDGSPELGVGEDSEWAFRQTSLRRPIRYLPKAVAFHDHYYGGPGSFRPRARAAGSAARRIAELHPRIAWVVLTRPRLAALAQSASMLSPTRWHRNAIWDLDYRWNFLLGSFLAGLSTQR